MPLDRALVSGSEYINYWGSRGGQQRCASLRGTISTFFPLSTLESSLWGKLRESKPRLRLE
jgi:hypothetical protein